MKNQLLLVLITALFSFSAHADRVILKNPIGQISGKVIHVTRFGTDTYVTVETGALTAHGKMMLAKSAEAVSQDLPISLGDSEMAKASPTPKPSATPAVAWQAAAMHYDQLPAKWDGQGITVAVVDTGVDYTHPNLKAHMWNNAKECAAGPNGKDNDGNGYINDCHGYDFDQHTADPMDQAGHGTHCSGIIAATLDVNTGAQGVAQGVTILPVRVIGSNNMGFLSDAAEGIKYAVDNGAKVLSNSWRIYKSWGGYQSDDASVALLHSAIAYAGQHGAIFVAAAGNESENMNTGIQSDPMFPGGFTDLPNMMVVAASTESGAMADYSNFGTAFVQVAAPGSDIISTVPGGQFETMSGTSMATPLVSGSLARGLSAGMTMEQAMEKLIETSDATSAWKGVVKSGGVIDLVKFLTP